MAYFFYILDIILLLSIADCTQIFLENATLFTAYCPSYKEYNATRVEVYLIKNNVNLYRYVCIDFSKPCDDGFSRFAILNGSGSYFPLEGKGILDMRQNNGINCVFKNSDHDYIDNFLIVAKPQRLECSEPGLSNDNKSILITCRTGKVYPQAVCAFDMQNKITGILNHSHLNYSDVVQYYNTTCTWTSPISNFEVGQYQYNVSFFPNGTSNNMIYGASLIQYFQLNRPKLNLSNECFNGANIVDGYIKPETNAYCTCYLENSEFPPSFVKWLYSYTVESGIPINSTATRLNISPSDDNKTFMCQGSNYIPNGNVFLNYTVKYALNPTACTVAPQTLIPTFLKICNKENSVNVTIFCDVRKSDVRPGIKSNISLNSLSSGLLDSEASTTTDDLYRTRYNALITQAGNYTIGCQVQNSLFDDSKTTCTFAEPIQVYAPPDADPILSITSKTNYLVSTVQENVVYIVKCSVLGGIPPVSNVTVSCGNITESIPSGNTFTSPVTFTRNMTGQNCTCTAQHITGCYSKNLTQQQLDILYSPNVTNFTQSAQYVENGDSIELICEADGNPPPLINITKGSNSLNQTSKGYNIVSLKKNMTCRDTGSYTCQADNGIYNKDLQMNIKKNVMIYVNCMLQFDKPETLTKEFSHSVGESFSYGFIIYGHPKPSNITVSKPDKKDTNLGISYSSLESPYIYVNLTIPRLTDDDFSNYTVKIFQNSSQSLWYTFYIQKVNQTAMPMEDFPVAAAIGGGIAAGCFVIILVVLLTYLVKKGICHKPKELSKYLSLKTTIVDNSDIYFLNVKIKDLFFMKKEKPKTLKKPEADTYKNYQDIVPTITSATTAPKNLYKPEVKPKPKGNNATEYYNFVEPRTPNGFDVSDKKQLLDENVYANQGFNKN